MKDRLTKCTSQRIVQVKKVKEKTSRSGGGRPAELELRRCQPVQVNLTPAHESVQASSQLLPAYLCLQSRAVLVTAEGHSSSGHSLDNAAQMSYGRPLTLPGRAGWLAGWLSAGLATCTLFGNFNICPNQPNCILSWISFRFDQIQVYIFDYKYTISQTIDVQKTSPMLTPNIIHCPFSLHLHLIWYKHHLKMANLGLSHTAILK